VSKGPIATAAQLLRKWLKTPHAAHRAKKVRKALHDLPAVKPPKPVPHPAPAVKSTAQRVAAAVKSQVGYHEGRSGGHWNNVEKYAALVPGLAWVSAGHDAWCDVFACWGLMTGGLEPGKDFPVSASCDTSADWYRRENRWSEYPAFGAQIFYGTAADLVHTGIVVAFDATTVTTVEGNTNTDGSPEGDGVYRKVHPRSSSYVVGYGYPRYPEGIHSADPAWKGRK
jgi:hypothetical protein